MQTSSFSSPSENDGSAPYTPSPLAKPYSVTPAKAGTH